MKKNCCLFLAMIWTANVFADNAAFTNAVTPAPNVVPAKKISTPAANRTKAAAKPAKSVAKVSEPYTVIVPGPATVSAENVNYRGQAGFEGESLGQLKKGDTVNVISVITLAKHDADEPSHWAKISLPAGKKVWVSKMYVTDKKVAVKKLNLRAGPGENYSVLGVIEKATTLDAVSEKGDWIQINAPSHAYAYVSARFLKQGAGVEVARSSGSTPFTPGPGPVVGGPMNPPTEIPAGAQTPLPAPTTVSEPPKISTPPTETPAANPSPTPIKLANLPPPPVETAEVETNAPPRIVTHEGWVRDSVSIVAPTYYELYDPSTGKAINYLHSTTPLLSVASYNGKHIAVTGEEALDAQWKDTPVLTIQKIYVLSSGNASTNAAAAPAKTAAAAGSDDKSKTGKRWYYLWLK